MKLSVLFLFAFSIISVTGFGQESIEELKEGLLKANRVVENSDGSMKIEAKGSWNGSKSILYPVDGKFYKIAIDYSERSAEGLCKLLFDMSHDGFTIDSSTDFQGEKAIILDEETGLFDLSFFPVFKYLKSVTCK